MPRKKTTEKFIKDAEDIHGDKYDYSKVDYQGFDKEVIIICYKHGDFKQLPGVHMHGNIGCQKCADLKRRETRKSNTFKNLIILAKKIHGDKYDYSQVIYIDSTIPVSIYCKKCKKYFNMTLSNHTHKTKPQNCSHCCGTKKLTIEEFNKRAKEVHNDEFDYSEITEIINCDTNIKIFCRKCKDYFYQTPYSHLKGSKCNGKCSKNKKKSKEEFLNEAKEKLAENFNNFDYSKTEYVNCHTNIQIICKIHNIEFIQAPHSHLKNITGCEECKKNKKQEIANKQKLTNEDFIIKAQKIHNNKYTYSKTNYIDTYCKIIITCPKHGDFEMSPSNHIHKTLPQDCPKCKCTGYSKKQIQWLDFISILHNITIQHAINNKEYKIENIGKIDGYCKENNTIYEFHGDLWHGNPMKFNILDKNSINPVNKKTYHELYETTLKRDKKIKELGYNLVIMWENEWDKINNSIKLLQNKWRDYKNKPHKCEKCNIGFKFKSQLEKHCKTELHKTGKKKTRSDKKEEFKCEICNLYTTNQQTNLKLHILNNHKTKEERKNEFPYYCKLCDSGYMKEKLYKKHLETKKHKKKLELLSK